MKKNIFKNKKKIGLLILAFLIILVAVVFIFRIQIVAHFIPKVKQIGKVHIRVENDTAFISSKLSVKNKSFLKIEIDTIRYEVKFQDKTYLQSEKRIGINLAAHKKDTIDFSLDIPYKTIIKDISTERKKGDSAIYSISVSLQYSTVFGKIEIPINKSAKIKIPQPPELSIVEIKYKKVHMKYILAEAKIKIINYSALSLSIKELSYSMNILEQGNMNGKFSEPIHIKPKGTTIVNLPIEININNIGKTIFMVIINKDRYNYLLKLKAILEVSKPSKESFQLNITQNGIMELRK